MACGTVINDFSVTKLSLCSDISIISGWKDVAQFYFWSERLDVEFWMISGKCFIALRNL